MGKKGVSFQRLGISFNFIFNGGLWVISAPLNHLRLDWVVERIRKHSTLSRVQSANSNTCHGASKYRWDITDGSGCRFFITGTDHYNA